MVRSAVDICLGTNPSQAPMLQSFENTSPAPIAATMALEMSGPMPGTVISRHAGLILTGERHDLAGETLNLAVKPLDAGLGDLPRFYDARGARSTSLVSTSPHSGQMKT